MAAFYPRGWINSNGETASMAACWRGGCITPQWRDGKQWLPAGAGGGSPPMARQQAWLPARAGGESTPMERWQAMAACWRGGWLTPQWGDGKHGCLPGWEVNQPVDPGITSIVPTEYFKMDKFMLVQWSYFVASLIYSREHG